MKPIEVYSFFAGVGLLDLGFEDAGFNIVFVNELNKQFLKSYQYARRNKPNKPKYGYDSSDIKSFLSNTMWKETFPCYDERENKLIGFIGGPPCPDFSTAGQNKGEQGKNGQLSSVYASLIIKRKPDFFILENVKGLYQTKKHREYYERLKKRLYRGGYSLFDSIENALSYGTPQFRDRLFLIGLKRSTFGTNISYEIGGNKKYKLERVLSCPWPKTNSFLKNGKIDKPEGIIDDLTVQYWFEKNDVSNHPNGSDVFSIKSRERFENTPEGRTKGKSFKRLHRWRYSPTACYGNNEVHLHPYYARRISVAEALAIQSLPKDFELPKDQTLSIKFKMIGNGVPYLLARGIAEELLAWINKKGGKND